MSDHWVASINEFPYSFRNRVLAHKLNYWRKKGLLKEGVHFMEYKEALAQGITVHGFYNRIPSSHRYVYNVTTMISRAHEILKPNADTPID